MRKNNHPAYLPSVLKNKSIMATAFLCVLPILCSIIFSALKLTGEADMKIIMRISIYALAGYGLFCAYNKKLNPETVIKLIIILGCILRIGYTLYTHAFTRGHDIGMNNADGVGHWGYFYHVVNGHLPPNNEYQFYQPPLYYLTGGLLIRFMMMLKGMDEWGGLEYIPQLVSCICSIIVLITTEKIMDKLKINKSVQIIPMVILAVYPAQILTGGRMNNDSMAQMFTVLALYATLLWHKERTIRNIVFIAFSIGLGMMTKINCAITAFVAGPIMVYHFVIAVRSKDTDGIKNLIIQFAVFAVICFPLGLWYGIRNYIKFDQPLNFVHELDKGLAIYTGNDPWIRRWVFFSLPGLKSVPYANMAEDCNVWMLLTKTGVHGEFTWDGLSQFLAYALDYVHLILMALTLAAVIFTFIKNNDIDKTRKFSALWVWALIAVSYIQFNATYPFSCTADFRYVLPAQIAGSLFTAYMCEYCFSQRQNRKYMCVLAAYLSTISVFCILSIMHFC